MKTAKLVLVCSVLMIFVINFSSVQTVERKQRDYVPDEATAKKIAEAILYPIYGENIHNNKPFQVSMGEDSTVWLVKGTLKKGMKGGVPYIYIRKSDCKIMKVYHTK
jgi:hypothetical protein